MSHACLKANQYMYWFRNDLTAVSVLMCRCPVRCAAQFSPSIWTCRQAEFAWGRPSAAYLALVRPFHAVLVQSGVQSALLFFPASDKGNLAKLVHIVVRKHQQMSLVCKCHALLLVRLITRYNLISCNSTLPQYFVPLSVSMRMMSICCAYPQTFAGYCGQRI